MENKSAITLCPLCKQTYVDPRILPCIHTFCLRCIEQQAAITASKTDLADDGIFCPVCSRNFHLPSGTIESLPRNMFMEKLVKINKISNPSYINQEVPCDQCRCDLDGDGDSDSLSKIRATGFCVECDEHLCEQCCASHRRTKYTKFHRVILLGGVDRGTRDNGLVSGDASTSRVCLLPHGHSGTVSGVGECEQHPQELLKMYCTTCERSICFLCYAEQHTGHKCSDINKIAESFMHRISLDVEDANLILSMVQADRDELEQKHDVFLTQIEQLQTAVQQKSTKLKSLIDMHCTELIEHLRDIKDSGLMKYQDKRNDIDGCWTLTEGFRNYAAELLDKGNMYEIIQSTHVFHQRIKELRVINSGHHDNVFKFSTVVYTPSNVQQLLTNEKISNLIGRVDSREHYLPVKTTSSADLSLSQEQQMPSVQITAKGSLVLRDCSNDGTCITVENTGVKCHFLGGYHVIRSIDGYDRYDYIITRDILVSARSKLRLWAQGCKPSEQVKSVCDVETTQKTWGLGTYIITKLEDQFGEECSTHVQTKMATSFVNIHTVDDESDDE